MVDSWFFHIVLKTCTIYNSCTSLIRVLYFFFLYIFLDWRPRFEPALQLNDWNLRALQNETRMRASILNTAPAHSTYSSVTSSKVESGSVDCHVEDRTFHRKSNRHEQRKGKTAVMLSRAWTMVLFRVWVRLSLRVIPKRAWWESEGLLKTNASFQRWTPWMGADKPVGTCFPQE